MRRPWYCNRWQNLTRSRSGTIFISVNDREKLQERLAKLYAAGTGSSNRIVAGLLVENPPSSAAGELTEKGTVNGRAVQRNRPELLDALFGDQDERVLRVEQAD